MPTSAEMFRSAQLRELQQTRLPGTAHVPLEQGARMPPPDRDLSALLLASQELQQQKLEIEQLRRLLMRSMQEEQRLQLQRAAQESRALQIRALRAALAAPPSMVAAPPPLAANLASAGLAQKHVRRRQPGTKVAPNLPPGLEFVRSSTMYGPQDLRTPGALAESLQQLAAQLGSSSDGSDNGNSRTASGYEAGASGSDKAMGSGSGSDGGWRAGAWRAGAQTASDASHKQRKSRAPASGLVPARLRTLVIGKFPRSTSDRALRDAFGLLVGHDNINFCRIAREKSGRSLCYAFVEFADVVAAEKAFEACDKGDLVFLDENNVAWQLTASRARRAQRPLKSCDTQTATATLDEGCNLMVKL